ncbi:MAG: flagellar basal body rod protein FlgC [Nitrospirae bacterium]|nr:flagellar basal body rod protein FlgC [Candidatus Troglogloeales bacterium]
MDIEKAFAISASGLNAQKRRLEVISSNLANVESTRTAEGGPYRRKDVLFAATPVAAALEEPTDFAQIYQGVKVSKIVTDKTPLKKVFEPNHPDADIDGYVLYPNVNGVSEMVNMLSALRSYDANVTAMDASKSMALKALEIGR